MSQPTFRWSLIGHKNITEFLERSIKTQNLAHAYLFYGPKNIGKHTLALNLTQILQCQKDKKPCGLCQNCQYIKKGIHPDVFTLKKQEDKKNIAINQVRELQRKLSLNSFSNLHKVAIIDQAETLSDEAWNSLLKTIEEPTPKTIIILITSEVNQIPETIISRSQVLRYKSVSQDEITNHLTKNLKIEKNQAKILSSLSFGRPGRAINFIDDSQSFMDYKNKANEFINLLKSDLPIRLKQIENYTKAKNTLPKNTFLENVQIYQNILQVWTLIIRDLCLLKNSQQNIVNKFQEKELENLKNSYTLTKLKNILKSIHLTREYLAQNASPKLVMENLLMQI